jgi:drug/metabolite transporter (DMT)-like permease
MLSAFLAALMNPIEVIGSKSSMKRLRINYAAFASVEMAFIFFIGLLPFFLWGEITAEFFTPKYLLSFAAIIIFGFLHNMFYFLALSKEDLCVIQPVAMLEPFASVALATIIFPDERNWAVFGLAVVASLALVASRIERKKFKVSKYTLTMLGYVACFAAEGIFIKIVLDTINPIALYILRVGLIAYLLLFYFKPNLKVFGEKRIASLLVVAVAVLIEFFSRYAAIESLGIVKSSLIFLLGPVLVLLGSKFYLKEKYTLKMVLADLIIVACIAALPFISK